MLAPRFLQTHLRLPGVARFKFSRAGVTLNTFPHTLVGGDMDPWPGSFTCMLKGLRCSNSWRVLAFIAEEKKINKNKECGMELNSVEVSAVLQERCLLQGHAPAPRARWAELQEALSESSRTGGQLCSSRGGTHLC